MPARSATTWAIVSVRNKIAVRCAAGGICLALKHQTLSVFADFSNLARSSVVHQAIAVIVQTIAFFRLDHELAAIRRNTVAVLVPRLAGRRGAHAVDAEASGNIVQGGANINSTIASRVLPAFFVLADLCAVLDTLAIGAFESVVADPAGTTAPVIAAYFAVANWFTKAVAVLARATESTARPTPPSASVGPALLPVAGVAAVFGAVAQ